MTGPPSPDGELYVPYHLVSALVLAYDFHLRAACVYTRYTRRDPIPCEFLGKRASRKVNCVRMVSSSIAILRGESEIGILRAQTDVSH